MSTRPRTKLRLVKCPKCAKILPEPKQVRVYACGGCHTILHAKYYISNGGSDLHEGDDDSREYKDSSHRSSSSGQQSMDEDENRDHDVQVHRNSSIMYSAYSSSLSGESTFLDDEDCTQKQIDLRLIENEELKKIGTVNREKEDNDDQLGQSDEHESLSTQNKDSRKLAPEKSDEKRGYDVVECVRELEGINLKDKYSTVSLHISETDSVSAFENSSPLRTSPRKIANFGSYSAAYESEHLNSMAAVNTAANSMKVDPIFLAKGSFADYEDCVSSFDGHDYQVPRHGFPPRAPPLYQSSEVTYETGSSSSYVQDELPGYHTNRLRKPHFQRGNVDGRRRRFSEDTWRENEPLPIYYSYGTSGEIYQRSKYYYHGYDDRKRRPYSSEMLKGRYQIPNPYNSHYRYSDELRWSGSDPYESLSYPTSPRAASSTQKRRAVKRHLEPLAGGAPFVTCYICFTVLKLPADFLLPERRKRRTHLLKCGSCSNILEFILKNECCLVSCVGNNDSGEAETDVGRDCNFTSEETLHQNDSFGGSESEKRKAASIREEMIEKSEDEEGACSSSDDQEKQMKVTWQLPARTKSPLHRLMGYSSPAHLLLGSDDDVEI